MVSLAANAADEEPVKRAYRSLFGDLADTRFDFSGAAACMEKEFRVTEPAPPPVNPS